MIQLRLPFNLVFALVLSGAVEWTSNIHDFEWTLVLQFVEMTSDSTNHEEVFIFRLVDWTWNIRMVERSLTLDLGMPEH